MFHTGGKQTMKIFFIFSLVSNKNCLFTYTSMTHTDRHLKTKLSSQSCSRDLLSPKRQRQLEVPKFKYRIACSMEKIVTLM